MGVCMEVCAHVPVRVYVCMHINNNLITFVRRFSITSAGVWAEPLQTDRRTDRQGEWERKCTVNRGMTGNY